MGGGCGRGCTGGCGGGGTSATVIWASTSFGSPAFNVRVLEKGLYPLKLASTDCAPGRTLKATTPLDPTVRGSESPTRTNAPGLEWTVSPRLGESGAGPTFFASLNNFADVSVLRRP